MCACPVCGNFTLGEEGGYEICSICNWEDDPYQREHPNYGGGANVLSMEECKALFLEKENSLKK